MAEHDEFQDQERHDDVVPWRDRPPEEHAAAFVELLGLVEAAGRAGSGKPGELSFPVIAERLARR